MSSSGVEVQQPCAGSCSSAQGSVRPGSRSLAQGDERSPELLSGRAQLLMSRRLVQEGQKRLHVAVPERLVQEEVHARVVTQLHDGFISVGGEGHDRQPPAGPRGRFPATRAESLSVGLSVFGNALGAA